MAVSLFGHNLLKSRIITTYIFQRYNHRKVNVTPVGSSFTPVYRFPYIQLCSMIAKYKKIQLGAFIIAVPSSYLTCSFTQLCGEHLPIVVSTVGAVSTIAVFSLGQLFNGIIGAIYVSRSKKQVKIAYLDFWGKRQDIVCSIDEITPIDESASFKDILYKYVSTSVIDNPLKINLSVGEIIDNSLFRQVFL